MGRIAWVQDSPGQKVGDTHYNEEKVGVVAHVCHSSSSGKLKIGGSRSTLTWSKSENLPQNNHNRSTEGMAHVAEHLPSES
jgi:hypothetical protein